MFHFHTKGQMFLGFADLFFWNLQFRIEKCFELTLDNNNQIIILVVLSIRVLLVTHLAQKQKYILPN